MAASRDAAVWLLAMTLLGMVLFALAGFGLRGRHFAPEWLGMACLMTVIGVALVRYTSGGGL